MTFANIRVLAALAFATLVSACNSPIVMVSREGVEPNYTALYNQPVPVLDDNITQAGQIVGNTDDRLAVTPYQARRADLLTEAWHLKNSKRSPCSQDETLLVTSYDGGPDWPEKYVMVCTNNDTGFARVIRGRINNYTFNNWRGADRLGSLPRAHVVDRFGTMRYVEMPREYYNWAINRPRGQSIGESQGCTKPAVIAMATALNGQKYRICVWATPL